MAIFRTINVCIHKVHIVPALEGKFWGKFWLSCSDLAVYDSLGWSCNAVMVYAELNTIWLAVLTRPHMTLTFNDCNFLMLQLGYLLG